MVVGREKDRHNITRVVRRVVAHGLVGSPLGRPTFFCSPLFRMRLEKSATVADFVAFNPGLHEPACCS